LSEGTEIELYAADTVQLNDDLIGQIVLARAATSLLDNRGREVIPAGAVFSGTVIKTEMSDGGGTTEALLLTFNNVEIDGASYGVEALTDSIAIRTEKGGISAGDVAKTGADSREADRWQQDRHAGGCGRGHRGRCRCRNCHEG
jgi:hypothetical protein